MVPAWHLFLLQRKGLCFIRQHDEIIYMNSGDWVDSLSALVEDYKGNWNIVLYSDMVKEEHFT